MGQEPFLGFILLFRSHLPAIRFVREGVLKRNAPGVEMHHGMIVRQGGEIICKTGVGDQIFW